jgi:hypothetical protein
MSNEYREDKRIVNFINNVEKQLYTAHESDKIREELYDHIECLIEDYSEAGISEDEAISKALKQMGDPKEIGYSFTDFEGLKSRKRLMMLYKVVGILVLLATLAFAFLSLPSEEADTGLFTLVYNATYLVMLFTSGSLMVGKSTKLFEFDTTPQLIIWPTKTRFPWEYLVLVIFFLPIVVIFFMIYLFENGVSSNSILGMWPVVTFSFSVWAIFYSEKFRIPKYMIIDEGIIIKGRFLSWTSISSFNWQKDYFSKTKEDYKLVIESFQRYNATVPVKKSICIHKRQQQQINRYLCERTK